ncbi:EthD domain-containing protein [Paraburkholderia bannensis]|uniref:EthD domain-containing protein n=1 Tax=Paraburkholderia bannensis TaxID=765414 RepID=UPI002AB6974C|nr:EthD domain-containing protein [Paraburkholderia bannensis]
MHSIAFLFKRTPGMTPDEFEHHYKNVHGPIAAQLPGLKEYRQYPIRKANEGDVHAHIPPDFDALSVYVFESTEAAEAAWESPENREVQIDTLKFIDVETMITLPLMLRQVV